jgi:kumamolisin
MPEAGGRIPLRGSHVPHDASARVVGSPAATGSLRVTLVLHPPDPYAGDSGDVVRAIDEAHPADRPRLTRAQLHAVHDPGEDAFRQVREFAAAHRLRVVGTSRVRHDVELEGSIADIESAFDVRLEHFEDAECRYFGHHGPIHLPPALAEIVDGVLGLDDMPLGRGAGSAAPADEPFSPAELAAYYGFPAAAEGIGRHRIALLQFGGGFHAADLNAFLHRFGITAPALSVESVAGADGRSRTSAPLDFARLSAIAADWKAGVPFSDLAVKYANDLGSFLATVEVSMDVQIVASLGGGAAIDVWFAPGGSVDDWRRTLYAALGEGHGSDAAGEGRPLPAAISISWGDSEAVFGAMKLRVIQHALLAASRMGVTTCCSTGDLGSSNSSRPGNVANVNFPASSPSVLACGGTYLRRSGGRPASENAWKENLLGLTMATGGGMSGYFPQPGYQASVVPAHAAGTWTDGKDGDFSGRWIPDVAASASFDPGVALTVGGQDFGGGGTSAATPIWAALVTRITAALGHPAGHLGPVLYGNLAAGACRNVTGGDNDVTGGKLGFYRAEPGWNACTGLGAPVGERLLECLRGT